MRWFMLFMAGVFTLGGAYLCFSRSNHYLERAGQHLDASQDKTISPDRANGEHIRYEVCSIAGMILSLGGLFAIPILHLVAFALLESRRSDARIRAMEEELKQLRDLVSENRQRVE